MQFIALLEFRSSFNSLFKDFSLVECFSTKISFP